jgi:hypothetical protein
MSITMLPFAGHVRPGAASLSVVPVPSPSAAPGPKVIGVAPGRAVSRQLGNNAAIAGQGGAWLQRRRSEVRAERMRLRRTMRKIASGMCGCTDLGDPEHRKCWAERMSRCELGRVASSVSIKVKTTAEHGRRASFGGLESCKSLSCPVCCGFMRERVAEKLADASCRWDEAGYAGLYAVLTVPHGVSDELKDTFGSEAAAWRRITSSRRWKQLREDTGVELLRTTEITHGAGSGWHPHQNLYLIAKTTDEATLAVKVIPVLRDLWQRECRRRGFSQLSAEHGVHVEVVQSSQSVAEYIIKDFGIGREMIRGDAKRGRGSSRTFFELVADYRERSDPADLALIHEYVQVTRGRRMLSASRGFWKLMASVGVGEPSEDELAEEPECEELGSLPSHVWDRVVRIWGLDAELLKAAETGGRDAVVRLLAKHKAWLVNDRGVPLYPSGIPLDGRGFPARRAKPSVLAQDELGLAL